MVVEISGMLQGAMTEFFLLLTQATHISKRALKGCGFSYFNSQRLFARPHFNSL